MLHRELRFLLHEVVGAADLLKRDAFTHLESADLDAILSNADDLATREFAPIAAILDSEPPCFADGAVSTHPRLAQALQAYARAGHLSAGLPLAAGGLQAPAALTAALMALFGAACTPAAGYAFLSAAAARLIQAFGDDWQRDTFLPPLRDGRWTGTMCLSEPHAGSALGDVRTRAIARPDGTYTLSGAKMWISGGDNDFAENIVHLVLARIDGGDARASGLSALIVPKIGLDARPNGVRTIGLNHKLGHRATTNCALSFGADMACTGYLIGEPHRGLSVMFHMMNEARIGVGVTAAATAYAGLIYASTYASGRIQGRDARTGSPALIVEHPDVRRMLLIQKAIAEGGLCLCLAAARLVDDANTHPDPGAAMAASRRLAILTPLVKLWCSERGVEANSLAIQVLGGAGYVRDHPVERLYRDQRLNPIHEGTNGILALDFVMRGLRRDAGATMAEILADIARDAAAGPDRGDTPGQAGGGGLGDALYTAQKALRALADAQGEWAQAWASPAALMVGDLLVAALWLRQTRALAGRTDAYARGKRAAAQGFLQLILPQSLAIARAIAAGASPPHLDLSPDVFAL